MKLPSQLWQAIQKLLNFSKQALQLMVSYLYNRCTIRTGVRKILRPTFRFSTMDFFNTGKYLEPILFNIYVADISLNIHGKSLQYADKTNIYHHTKSIDLQSCIELVTKKG